MTDRLQQIKRIYCFLARYRTQRVRLLINDRHGNRTLRHIVSVHAQYVISCRLFCRFFTTSTQLSGNFVKEAKRLKRWMFLSTPQSLSTLEMHRNQDFSCQVF